ncbi:MAG: MBL fold metallo-hydrolase [Candidatus Liptonbacteria bacterium]|nr:MBL fold metallo-hydrolase [Candidatus Liptonbacteria bacterium]
MKIHKYFHSCLLLKDGDTRILFDPGGYSFLEGRAKPEDFSGIDAIVVTHSHKDHADPRVIKEIMSRNNTKIISNVGVKDMLAKDGINCEIGDENGFKIGNFFVKPVKADHEKTLRAVPENTAYVVNDVFLHPGDSLNKNLYSLKIKALALPVAGPWGKVTEFAEFAKNVGAETVIPIHDGVFVEEFINGQYKMWEDHFSGSGIRFFPLRTTKEFLEI